MKSLHTQKMRLSLNIILVALMVMVLPALPPLKLDMTREKLFTLSKAALDLLAKQDEKMVMRLYYSPELGNIAPQYGAYHGRVQDMLHEFIEHSGGMLSLEIINPEPFSLKEDMALADGLQGAPVSKDGSKLYFGLSLMKEEYAQGRTPNDALQPTKRLTAHQENIKTIAFLQPDREAFLEYDLLRLMDGMKQKTHPILGIISGAEAFGATADLMRGLPVTPWAIIDQAKEFYEVREILSAEQLFLSPPDILLLLHPNHLTPNMLYAVDQHILAKRATLIFYDPHHETPALSGHPTGYELTAASSDLAPLLEKWHLKISTDWVVGNMTQGQMVQMHTGNQMPVPYPAWLGISKDYFDNNNPLFAHLQQIMMPSAGHIEIDPAGLKQGMTLTPLIWGHEESYKIASDKLEQPDPFTVLKDAEPIGTRPILGGIIKGELASAYDAPPLSEPDTPADEDSHEHAEARYEADMPLLFANHQHLSKGEANLTLIADADMLADMFWVQRQNFLGESLLSPINDNGAFFLNLLDQLQGDLSLSSLRGRGVAKSPFLRIDNMRREAEIAYRAKEGELLERLTVLEDDLQQGQKQQESPNLNPNHNNEALDKIIEEILNIRGELRLVHHELRKNVLYLENFITYGVTLFLPLMLLCLALSIALKRKT